VIQETTRENQCSAVVTPTTGTFITLRQVLASAGRAAATGAATAAAPLASLVGMAGGAPATASIGAGAATGLGAATLGLGSPAWTD
jgi:hypothetical protein